MWLMDTVIGFVGGFLLMILTNGIGLIPWRRSAGLHWAERARILWPVRRTASLTLFLGPSLVIFGMLGFGPGRWVNVQALWLSGFVGGVLGTWLMTRELFPDCSFRKWWMEFLLTFGLRQGFVVVCITVIVMMPQKLGLGAWSALVAVALLFFIWGALTLRLLRVIGVIRPAGARLERIVANCRSGQDVRVTRVWEAVGHSANAFALPRTGELVFMERMLEDFSDDEIAAICSHELGHLGEPTKVLIGRYIGSMAFLPFLVVRPVMDGWGMHGLLVLFGCIILWARLARRLANRMEERADAEARAHEASEGVYARVLEKLYELNQVPAVTHGSSQVHPHLYDRMVAAGVTPAFPRPGAPGRFTALGWFLLLSCVGMVVWSMKMTEPPRPHRKSPAREGVSLPERAPSHLPRRAVSPPLPGDSDSR